MKKILLALTVAAVTAFGLFAEDVTDAVNALGNAGTAVGEVTNSVETLQGTWFDKKYNCNWTFQMNTGDDVFCILTDATSNAVIYKFTKANVQKFKSEITSEAFTISWESEAKNRVYRFSKPISITQDLQLDIYNNVYAERHSEKITYVAADARVN